MIIIIRIRRRRSWVLQPFFGRNVNFNGKLISIDENGGIYGGRFEGNLGR